VWRIVRIAAGAREVSANAYCVAAIRAALLRDGSRDKLGPVAAALDQRAER
jgi:hypothetical protein